MISALMTVAPVRFPVANREAPRQIWAAPALLLIVMALLVGCSGGGGPSVPEVATFSYLIPAGAGFDIEHGKPLDILPGEIQAKLGETIQIVNNDVRAHQLGPWFVGAGETLRQRFTETGTFQGSCSVHPSGEFSVIVEA
ncbi:MAG: hypothetical protein ACJA14_000758 [Ilumatobacter sp.]